MQLLLTLVVLTQAQDYYYPNCFQKSGFSAGPKQLDGVAVSAHDDLELLTKTMKDQITQSYRINGIKLCSESSESNFGSI